MLAAFHLIAPVLHAAAQQPLEDEFNPGVGLFALGMFGLFLLLVVSAIVLVAGLAGATIASVALVALFALAAIVAVTMVVHILLAILIWTRRPPTRVMMHKRWWGLFTLAGGLLVAVPFFALHYRRGAAPRCFGCGHSRAELNPHTPCPECGRFRHVKADPRFRYVATIAR